MNECRGDYETDLGLLHEWQWPGQDWEIVTGEEVSRRMRRVGAGTAPGPVSHACPPGVLSGMSQQQGVAVVLAENRADTRSLPGPSHWGIPYIHGL